MQKTNNLQEVFLNHVRKEGAPVTVFLTNGFQMRGCVRAYDSFTIILDSDGRQQLIYKHAVSTVVPAKPVPFVHGLAEREVEQVE